MNQNEIYELNKALKGEHMAIESFDHYIQDTHDENTKKKLMEMQQLHQFHAMQLSERIQKIGGDPANASGIAGLITEVKHKLQSSKYVDNSVIKTAVEGEEIGIKAYGEIYASLSDPDNKKLAEEMLRENSRILNDLNGMV